MVRDSLLLCAFGLQHSCMASQRLKGFFDDIGLPVLARPVYICCTCFVINVSEHVFIAFQVYLYFIVYVFLLVQVIHHFWQPISSHTLWHLESNSMVVAMLLVLHLMCWVLIAASIFTIDYLELLGIKQVSFHYVHVIVQHIPIAKFH